ncbi:MAG: ATP-binding protein, partial [Anaerolineae bacterium]|nr:ATP-binding protein [Anaerolineae bacterium]
ASDFWQTYLGGNNGLCLERLMLMEGKNCLPEIINCRTYSNPFSLDFNIQQVIAVCLEHDGNKYGTLLVGVTRGFQIDKDEPSLIQDTASDLAFALYSIEQERAREQAESDLAQKIDAEERFQERLRVLSEITNELALSESSEALCQRAIEMGVLRLGFDRIGMWLKSEMNPKVLVGTFGTDEQGNLRDERHLRRRIQDEFSDLDSPQRSVVTKYSHVPLHDCVGEIVGTGMQMSARIWNGNQFIGLLDIDNLFTHRNLDAYDEEILGLYAAALGHLYLRSKAEERLQQAVILHQQRAVQLESLNAVIAQTVTATEIDDLVDVVLHHSVNALNLTSGSVWALDAESRTGACDSVVQPLLRRIVNMGVNPGSILSVFDVKELRAILSAVEYPEWAEDVADALEAHQISSLLAAPVMVGQMRIGGVIFTRELPGQWSYEETQLVAAIAHQLGSAAERIKLMEEVQLQVNRLQIVMDTVPEGVVLLGQHGEVMLTNKRGQDDLAYLAHIGKGDWVTNLGNLPLQELLVNSARSRWHDVRQEDRTFEVMVKPASDPTEAGGWVMVIRDVTEERILAEHQKRQERLAALGRMAAGIAHDFNNIMAVVVLYAQMAARQPDLNQATRDRLTVVTDQTRRATDLILQILDFSRRSTLETQSLDLGQFLDQTCEMIRRTLPDGITLELQHDDRQYDIKGDATRLQQVLMNLTNNACEAMPDGGVISISLDTIVVEEQGLMYDPSLSPGVWQRLRFSDTGSGIPNEMQPYLFEPFYSTKMRNGGTGLGLAQVHGIIKQHDGEITVDSRENQGTTFTLFLPAGPETAELQMSVDTSTSVLRSGHAETILLVEDNHETRGALSQALHSLSYTVIEAENGIQAMAILEHSPDVRAVLSDAIMPEMGGVGLLKAMQNRAIDVPVVILSGYLAPEIRAELSPPENLVAWLSKPVDFYALADALAQAVALSR